MPKRLHVFTPVWNPHFTNLFEKALGLSLSWPRNRASVENCIWTIATDSESAAVGLKETAQRILPNCEVRIQIEPRFSERDAPIGALKMQCLLKSIRQCLDEKTPMLMSTPDFIWADGSIANMLAEAYVSEGQSLCVSIAHMRCLPGLMDCLRGDWRMHHNLVGLGLEFAHDSWVRCNVGLDPNGIYHSGLSWRVVGGGLITVQHQMPSPFLVNFTESDLAEFQRWKGVTPPAFGEWDHNWPTKLIKEERLRYIGSSDVAFMVEVTESDKNVPPLNPAKTPHDSFFRTEEHLRYQKQFISVFRY